MASIESNSTLNLFWRNHIAQWQTSGLSQAEYCRQYKLTGYQFSYWKKRLLVKNDSVAHAPQTGFARVQIAESIPTPVQSELSLHFRGGIQLVGITQESMPLIQQLVEVLR
jgi:hypothetical protein